MEKVWIRFLKGYGKYVYGDVVKTRFSPLKIKLLVADGVAERYIPDHKRDENESD
jgi:hypothetical protein